MVPAAAGPQDRREPAGREGEWRRWEAPGPGALPDHRSRWNLRCGGNDLHRRDQGGAPENGGYSGSGGTTATAGTTGAGGFSSGTGGGPAAGTSGLSSLADNFRFLANTDSWTATGVNASASFTPEDAEGTGTTGSLRLAQTHGDTALTTLVAATQCLSATAGETFELDVSVKVPDPTTSGAYIEIVGYPSDACWGP